MVKIELPLIVAKVENLLCGSSIFESYKLGIETEQSHHLVLKGGRLCGGSGRRPSYVSDHLAFLATMILFGNLVPLVADCKLFIPPFSIYNLTFSCLCFEIFSSSSIFHMCPCNNGCSLKIELLRIITIDFCAHFLSLCALARENGNVRGSFHNMLHVIVQSALATLLCRYLELHSE